MQRDTKEDLRARDEVLKMVEQLIQKQEFLKKTIIDRLANNSDWLKALEKYIEHSEIYIYKEYFYDLNKKINLIEDSIEKFKKRVESGNKKWKGYCLQADLDWRLPCLKESHDNGRC